MQPFQDFSSWQPEQERQFVVFEQRTVEASKRAWAIGIFAGIAFGIAMIGITIAVPVEERKMESAASTTPDLGSEGAPAATLPSAASTATTPAPAASPAPAPAADPAAAPATDPAAAPATDPAAAPAADPAAAQPAAAPAAEGAATAPPPPPGATKAPPTDLVKGQK